LTRSKSGPPPRWSSRRWAGAGAGTTSPFLPPSPRPWPKSLPVPLYVCQRCGDELGEGEETSQGRCPCGGSLDPNGATDGGPSWIVAGAPKGHEVRGTELDWYRRIRDAAAAGGVPFWLKSLGPRSGRTLDGRTHSELPAGWPGLEVA